MIKLSDILREILQSLKENEQKHETDDHEDHDEEPEITSDEEKRAYDRSKRKQEWGNSDNSQHSWDRR